MQICSYEAFHFIILGAAIGLKKVGGGDIKCVGEVENLRGGDF